MEEILHQAERLEKKYDWVEAVGLYEKAVKLLPQDDFSRIGEIHERSGYASYCSAFQAESNDEFRERLRKAILGYERAKELYGRLNEAIRTPRILRCEAMIAHWSHWLAADVPEKKRLLDECWRIGKEALKSYEQVGDKLGYGKTCVDLTSCLDDRLDLELDIQMREKILDEALSLGEKAIKLFSDAGDERELARAYCFTSIHCYNAALSLQLETKRRECAQKAFDYLKEAVRISKGIGDKLVLSRSTVCRGSCEHDLGAGARTAFEFFQEAVQYCTETKDHCILCEAFDGLAESVYWNMTLEEDIEKAREKSRECEEYASKAISCSIPANYSRGVPHSYSWGYVANLTDLAKREIGLETRHALLQKAVALGKQGLEYIHRTGSTHAIFHISAELSTALYNLATLETGIERGQLLEEALKLGENAVYFTEPLRPHFMWPQSLSYKALALTLFELGKLEEKTEKRKELLEKSVSGMEKCITSLQRHVTSFPSRIELFALLGSSQTELGDILRQLYETTAEREILRKLIEAYQSAVQMNLKASLTGRVAEAYWQTAVTYDRLGEYLESADNFESASKQYELSAQSIPQLRSFYMDYATYMQAWSDIEKARHNHGREEYGRSEEYYRKAANALRSSKSWSYLAPNYLAWAHLAHAEDLSRENQTQQATQAFMEAAKLFSQGEKSVQAESDRIPSPNEKDMAVKLSEASDLRGQYCLARILIEEAKNLFSSGDCVASAEKYGNAAKKLERIAQVMEIETERKELLPMIHMCHAWQKMSAAEETADASLYVEASELFMKAKESSVKKRTAMLAAGNSCICRALELGAKYKSTKTMVFYSEGKHQMESASDYYMEAGFENASTWVSATEALFDAYFYMDKAETEPDHKDKTKFYGLVEGYLDRSAKLFNKAGYTKKAGDVLRTLERVKEKREFALSLDKVLVAPAVTSSTASMPVPRSSHEEAVGLERFEHADIQANLIVRQKDLKVGENLEVGLELVNSGKGPAVLTKITEIIPQGFQLAEKPSMYRVQDAYLNMKGKRLDPLKMEEVRFTLKPSVPGVFPLKPVILYLDDSGKYRSHQPESVSVTVKEPAIEALTLEVPKGSQDRVITGHKVLDHLLLGGIPRNCGVVLTSPSCDERELLVESFLETGIEKGDVTFYVTINPDEAKILAENFQSNFCAFICNPHADAIVESQPNVFKLRGVENLTDISIALASAIRKLDARQKARRICIEIISDVLLQHHAIQTRRWLTALMTELKSTGFTTLATVNPQIHPQQELQAILDLFEGEINIFEKGHNKYLKILKMSNQKYLEDELLLNKE